MERNEKDTSTMKMLERNVPYQDTESWNIKPDTFPNNVLGDSISIISIVFKIFFVCSSCLSRNSDIKNCFVSNRVKYDMSQCVSLQPQTQVKANDDECLKKKEKATISQDKH